MNKHAQELGKLGGKKSVKKRFKGKTKKQISEMMSRVRKKLKVGEKGEDNTFITIQLKQKILVCQDWKKISLAYVV
jgi:hypothetical protein